MRLIRAELGSKTQPKHVYKFRAGLNVVQLPTQEEVSSMTESLCAAVLLIPVRAALSFGRLKLEFEDANGTPFSFNSVEGEEVCLYKENQLSSPVPLNEFRQNAEMPLSPQSFTFLAGISSEEFRGLSGSTVPDSTQLRQEVKALERKHHQLHQDLHKISDLMGKLQASQKEGFLDEKIESLPPEALKQLRQAPQKQERLDSRESQILSARIEELQTPAETESLLKDRNFQISILGIVLSFTLAYLFELPILAIANVLFAALLVQVLLKRIDEEEQDARRRARKKAVDGAEVRNRKAKQRASTALQDIAQKMDCDLQTLERSINSLEERKRKQGELKNEIATLGKGRTPEDLRRELDTLSENIASHHGQILEENFVLNSPKANLDRPQDDVSQSWVRLFLEQVIKDLGSDFSISELENHVLPYLQRLSEGRFDGVTISADATLTVVGPDDIFPVSYQKLSTKDQSLIGCALRFGFVSYLSKNQAIGVVIFRDLFHGASRGRRLRFFDALESLGKTAQIVVVSAASDWPSSIVRSE